MLYTVDDPVLYGEFNPEKAAAHAAVRLAEIFPPEAGENPVASGAKAENYYDDSTSGYKEAVAACDLTLDYPDWGINFTRLIFQDLGFPNNSRGNNLHIDSGRNAWGENFPFKPLKFIFGASSTPPRIIAGTVDFTNAVDGLRRRKRKQLEDSRFKAAKLLILAPKSAAKCVELALERGDAHEAEIEAGGLYFVDGHIHQSNTTDVKKPTGTNSPRLIFEHHISV